MLEYKTKINGLILTTWETRDKGFLTKIETEDKSQYVIGFRRKSRTSAKLSAIKYFRKCIKEQNQRNIKKLRQLKE